MEGSFAMVVPPGTGRCILRTCLLIAKEKEKRKKKKITTREKKITARKKKNNDPGKKNNGPGKIGRNRLREGQPRSILIIVWSESKKFKYKRPRLSCQVV